MDGETYDCKETVFYRNTLEGTLTDDICKGIPTKDASALEEYLNKVLMDKEGTLGIHSNVRPGDGETVLYLDYFKQKDGKEVEENGPENDESD